MVVQTHNSCTQEPEAGESFVLDYPGSLSCDPPPTLSLTHTQGREKKEPGSYHPLQGLIPGCLRTFWAPPLKGYTRVLGPSL